MFVFVFELVDKYVVVLLSSGCDVLLLVVRTVWEFVRRVGVGSDAFTAIFVRHIWLILRIIYEIIGE